MKRPSPPEYWKPSARKVALPLLLACVLLFLAVSCILDKNQMLGFISLGLCLWAVLIGMRITTATACAKKRLRNMLLDELPIDTAQSILDFGCVKGLMLLPLAERAEGKKITGVIPPSIGTTLSIESLLQKVDARGLGEKVDIISCDSSAMPFPSESFDMITSYLVISEIPRLDYEALLLEFTRILRPGGLLVITDSRGINNYQKTLKTIGYERVWKTNPVYIDGRAVHTLFAYKAGKVHPTMELRSTSSLRP